MTETLQAPNRSNTGGVPRWGVVVFPGSNCDQDTYHVLRDVLGQDARYVWHEETDLSDLDAVILPGGFAHGDYLRAGAVARFSPVMDAVIRFAETGKPVVGICNGFQVLLEAGLIPGAMRRNQNLRFLCRDVYLRVERTDLPFTWKLREGAVLRIPIAHGEGNYEDSPERLDALEANRQVVFRYVTPEGARADADPQWNPNGAARAIAGICNPGGNVLGMMPHPERCSEPILGNTDGLTLLASAVEAGSQVLGARR